MENPNALIAWINEFMNELKGLDENNLLLPANIEIKYGQRASHAQIITSMVLVERCFYDWLQWVHDNDDDAFVTTLVQYVTRNLSSHIKTIYQKVDSDFVVPEQPIQVLQTVTQAYDYTETVRKERASRVIDLMVSTDALTMSYFVDVYTQKKTVWHFIQKVYKLFRQSRIGEERGKTFIDKYWVHPRFDREYKRLMTVFFVREFQRTPTNEDLEHVRPFVQSYMEDDNMPVPNETHITHGIQDALSKSTDFHIINVAALNKVATVSVQSITSDHDIWQISRQEILDLYDIFIQPFLDWIVINFDNTVITKHPKLERFVLYIKKLRDFNTVAITIHEILDNFWNMLGEIRTMLSFISQHDIIHTPDGKRKFNLMYNNTHEIEKTLLRHLTFSDYGAMYIEMRRYWEQRLNGMLLNNYLAFKPFDINDSAVRALMLGYDFLKTSAFEHLLTTGGAPSQPSTPPRPSANRFRTNTEWQWDPIEDDGPKYSLFRNPQVENTPMAPSSSSSPYEMFKVVTKPSDYQSWEDEPEPYNEDDDIPPTQGRDSPPPQTLPSQDF